MNNQKQEELRCKACRSLQTVVCECGTIPTTFNLIYEMKCELCGSKRIDDKIACDHNK